MNDKIKRGLKYNIEGRYFNANGFAVAIVAVITHEVDWATYIGGTFGDKSESETIQWVIKYGCKLPDRDAYYFFPEFKHLPYRY